MLEIRKGKTEDIQAIGKLYDRVNETLEKGTNWNGWRKGIYPIQEDAQIGIEADSLFVACEDGQIIASMILKNKPEPAYAKVTWQIAVADEEAMVLYTFVVDASRQSRGIGKKMLEYAMQYAKDLHMKAFRLDVYEKNEPAIYLYERFGFQYIDTISLGLEEYGLPWFRLYEIVL